MHRMQGRCGWRWHPCTIRPSLWMAGFLINHICHHIWHGPHALADLCPSGKAAGQTHIHIPIFISANPCGLLHITFADHRASFHGCVNFITCAVQKAGIDKHHPVLGSADTFSEIDGCASFFIHNAHFDGGIRQTQQFLNGTKKLIGKSHLFRAVHFRLHNIDRACARIAL